MPHRRHCDLQELAAFGDDNHGYFKPVEEATQQAYRAVLLRLIFFLTRMTMAPPSGAEGGGVFVQVPQAMLPDAIHEKAHNFRGNPTPESLHSLLMTTFTPFTPITARNEHPVGWFCWLAMRSADGVYIEVPAVRKIAVALIHSIRLVVFHELTLQPATAAERTKILEAVKIK